MVWSVLRQGVLTMGRWGNGLSPCRATRKGPQQLRSPQQPQGMCLREREALGAGAVLGAGCPWPAGAGWAWGTRGWGWEAGIDAR